MDLFQALSVLFVEESPVRRDLFEEWLPVVETKTAANQSEFYQKFDSSVVVVSLSQTALEVEADRIRQYIMSHNPYSRLIGILPRSSFTTPYEDHYDEIIQRLVFKEDLQSTIESELVVGAYSSLLRDLYKINSLLVAIRKADKKDLVEKQAKIETIESRQDEIESKLDRLQERLSQELLFEILETIEHRDEYLKTPTDGDMEQQGTKYLPQRCASCQLPWGVNHRNDLGAGYTKLGADVYQCKRCESVIHGLADEQRVY